MLFPLWKVHVLCILTPPWYIELIFSYFYLLNTCVDLSKSSWHDPHYLLIDRAPLACFSCVIHIFHFCCPFCVHSILFSCFSYWSMVPCSSCSLCVSFCLSMVKFFDFLCHLTIVSKRGEIWDLNVIPQGSDRFRGRTSC